jgi:chromosome partitioning protein
VAARYDFVFIDCPPSLGLLTVNALAAAARVLVPIQCEYYALEGVTSLMNTISRINRTINPALDIEGVLLTMLDGRTNLGLQVVDQVKRRFRNKVYTVTIPRNVRLGEAPSHGLPIHLYDSRSAGAEAYRALAKEVMERNGVR